MILSPIDAKSENIHKCHTEVEESFIFSTRLLNLNRLDETVKIYRRLHSSQLEHLKLEGFDWDELTKFETESSNFQSTPIWCSKFVKLRKSTEVIHVT